MLLAYNKPLTLADFSIGLTGIKTCSSGEGPSAANGDLRWGRGVETLIIGRARHGAGPQIFGLDLRMSANLLRSLKFRPGPLQAINL
jgi:hypothetical protein